MTPSIEATDFVLKAFLHYFHEPPQSRGIEVGANENWSCHYLTQLGMEMTGIDANPWRPDSITPYASFDPEWVTWHRQIQGPFESLDPVLDPPYDFGVALSSIEHFGLNYYGEGEDEAADTKAMEHLCRLVKPGGRLYIMVPVGRWAVTPHWRRYDQEQLKQRILIPSVRLEKGYICQWDGGDGVKGVSPSVAWNCADVGCIYEALLLMIVK